MIRENDAKMITIVVFSKYTVVLEASIKIEQPMNLISMSAFRPSQGLVPPSSFPR